MALNEYLNERLEIKKERRETSAGNDPRSVWLPFI